MLEKYAKKLLEHRGIVVPAIKSAYSGLVSESDKKADKNTILQVVFKRQPETGRPVNDLALVENVHLAPNVREFIKQNLQAPVEAEKGLLDPALAVELARKPYETIDAYRQRLTTIAYDGEAQIKAASNSIRKGQKMAKIRLSKSE